MTAGKLAALVSGQRAETEPAGGVPRERTREFPGDARQVGAARRFVARALDGSPAREMLLICVSELAANAVEHTESGVGGVFTVTAGQSRDGTAFVAVTDEGGTDEPGLPRARGRRGDSLSEGGRGLTLVDACSSRWGYRDSERGRTVWAEVGAGHDERPVAAIASLPGAHRPVFSGADPGPGPRPVAGRAADHRCEWPHCRRRPR